MRKIIPTIFATNNKEFRQKFSEIVPLSEDLQIDFMDGKFVPGKSVKISQVPELKRFNKSFEAHLMIFNPEKKILEIKRKGFGKVIIHYETIKGKEEKVIEKARDAGLEVFIAINPETPAKDIFPLITKSGGILVMGVHPGKEHQEIIESTYEKIKEIKGYSAEAIVQIDGGVNIQTAKKLKQAGADILNTGSFVSGSENPKDSLEKLRKIFL